MNIYACEISSHFMHKITNNFRSMYRSIKKYLSEAARYTNIFLSLKATNILNILVRYLKTLKTRCVISQIINLFLSFQKKKKPTTIGTSMINFLFMVFI